jgi:hypothetical protein
VGGFLRELLLEGLDPEAVVVVVVTVVVVAAAEVTGMGAIR